MEINLLLRGQSNSYYFDQMGGAAILKNQLQFELGFDGVTDKLTSSPP